MSDTVLDNTANASTPSSTTPTRGAGYAVYDPVGQKIGSAEEVFVNWNEEPEYVRVRIGLFGRRSVIIPVQSVSLPRVRRGDSTREPNSSVGN